MRQQAVSSAAGSSSLLGACTAVCARRACLQVWCWQGCLGSKWVCGSREAHLALCIGVCCIPLPLFLRFRSVQRLDVPAGAQVHST